MYVTYKINDRLCDVNVAQLVRDCEFARAAIWKSLGEIDVRLQREQSAFVCQIESSDLLHMHIKLHFPGASAFAQVEWKKSVSFPQFNAPPWEQIVQQFMRRNDTSIVDVSFRESRLGQAITWALENGHANIKGQYDDSCSLSDIELKELEQTNA